MPCRISVLSWFHAVSTAGLPPSATAQFGRNPNWAVAVPWAVGVSSAVLGVRNMPRRTPATAVPIARGTLVQHLEPIDQAESGEHPPGEAVAEAQRKAPVRRTGPLVGRQDQPHAGGV